MKERLTREGIARRIAKELKDGECVNLGFGMGVVVSSFIPPEKRVIFHSETGVIGYGRVLTADEAELMDYNLVNAGGQYVARLPGMSICDCAEAFNAIRIGRVDVTVLGALQVSEKGDLANWTTDPRGGWGTIGGAMDMPIGAKKVIIGMTHTAKDDKPKIVKKCTLPLTAPECVDLIVTDVAVIEVSPSGLVLKEFAPGWTPEEIQAITEPRLTIAPDLKEMEL
jgi:3-oxoacid CoA-transferase B subunit